MSPLVYGKKRIEDGDSRSRTSSLIRRIWRRTRRSPSSFIVAAADLALLIALATAKPELKNSSFPQQKSISIRSLMSSWVPVHILTNPCFILGPRTRLNCRHFTNCFINSLATKSHAFFHHQIRAWKPDVDTIVSDNAKYGGKQIISVTPRLYDYILGNVREPEILLELREETATMQVSPDQAQLLAMLVQVQGAKRCIEVGIYTVDVRHGIAADTLRSMIQNGEGCSYDFAFIDADKKMYQEYFELLLKLVRVGGVVVVDNVLWHGRVADLLVNDSKTTSIRSFNRTLFEDNRVDISMVPTGDGMTICRKR
nr:O-methyltransferase MdmC-like isoform X1 [Ipomoea batatas]